MMTLKPPKRFNLIEPIDMILVLMLLLVVFVIFRLNARPANQIRAVTTFEQLKVDTIDLVDGTWKKTGECMTQAKAVLMIHTHFKVLKYATSNKEGFCRKGAFIRFDHNIRNNAFLTVDPSPFLKT